jgi:hypothetical protein
MRSILANLALLCAALCPSAAFAANPAQLKVPFSFEAKGHTYPAGLYNVKLDDQRLFVTLSRADALDRPLTWIAGPGGEDPAQRKAALEFDLTGQEFVLRTIQCEGRITPNLDSKRKQAGKSAILFRE